MTNVFFHPEIPMIEAQAIAKKLDCVLAWRGDRFVMRRVQARPKPRGFRPSLLPWRL